MKAAVTAMVEIVRDWWSTWRGEIVEDRFAVVVFGRYLCSVLFGTYTDRVDTPYIQIHIHFGYIDKPTLKVEVASGRNYNNPL